MDGNWRIGQFAARVGVAAVTLRAWERRYGLLRPGRTPAGYRLYTPLDEQRVRAMQAHMAIGVAAAEAAELAIRDVAGDAVAPEESRAELLRAVAAYDARGVDSVLARVLADGRVAALRDVVLPAMASVGDEWARRELSVGQEHLCTHLVERRLLALASAWNEGPGPLALLACPSGERHSLGLVCFGLALADHGWRVSYLGADTPVSDVREAGDRLGPQLVVLAALDPTPLRAGREGIAGLARAHRTAIGGAGASQALADQVGCRYLAADPVGAAAEVAAA
jgi:DNA-binding transcriptional MerR regulator